ncbi:hypothetical protein NDU88_000748 [Pleurodeles waltl]|uniref:Uncharacterized protein n=1 Tax=Pleurodeles waltl TaxID=8319 RepID=A0AAV7TGB6_PLEWA|nr:hypothetical protein NDU88_000748 [Pleurodeles waltl]
MPHPRSGRFRRGPRGVLQGAACLGELECCRCCRKRFGRGWRAHLGESCSGSGAPCSGSGACVAGAAAQSYPLFSGFKKPPTREGEGCTRTAALPAGRFAAAAGDLCGVKESASGLPLTGATRSVPCIRSAYLGEV